MNTSNKGPSSKKKGRSKKAHVLAVSVEQATQNFLEKGEQIAKDSQDLKEELIAAVEDVRKQGNLNCSYGDGAWAAPVHDCQIILLFLPSHLLFTVKHLQMYFFDSAILLSYNWRYFYVIIYF